jgi:hypothetical protein
MVKSLHAQCFRSERILLWIIHTCSCLSGFWVLNITNMKTVLLILFGVLLGVLLVPYLDFRKIELPVGTNLKSPDFVFDNAQLLIDRTSWDAQADRVVLEHTIFDTVLGEIRAAETCIIADFFLWNPWQGAVEASGTLRPLAVELADALITKRRLHPKMPIVVITDPINRIYGDQAPEFYARMAAAGIAVVFTDLTQLPDSNRVYAPQMQFWSETVVVEAAEEPILPSGRYLPNPFDSTGEKLTLAQMGRLLYFKANHRKVLVTGRLGDRWRLVVGSFNPADGSANHSNVGALVEGPVAVYAAESELAVAEWSSADPANVQVGSALSVAWNIVESRKLLPALSALPLARMGQPSVAWRSEGAIQEELVAQLDAAGEGTRVDAAIFYFSARKVVEAMKGAIVRGAIVRVLMDANRDAFGRQKNGVPGRPVAAELMELAEAYQIEIRWAATHGEQYHVKVLRVMGPAQDVLILGSANWTRRNLDNLNLEADLLFKEAGVHGAAFDTYFESLWTNGLGVEESLPYADWAESGWSLSWKTWLYRFQEWSGASTF